MSVVPRHSAVHYFSLPLDESQVVDWTTRERSVLAGPVTFGLLFCAPEVVEDAREILDIIRIYARTPVVLGCSTEGMIADSKELEGAGGFCIALYSLPGTRAHSFYLKESYFLEEERSELGRQVGTIGSSANGWLLFAASGNLSHDSWLRDWDQATGGRPTVGGFTGKPSMVSTALFCDGEIYTEGAVALALEGDVSIEPVLSQGCRPIGSPWTITRADHNIIHQIGNRPILEVLRDTLEKMSFDEQQQARGNIFIGLVMDEYKANFGTGDFLVRNLAAIDPETGSVAIATPPRVGQNLQFQIRDALSASVDFEETLKKRLRTLGERRVFGAFLGDCIGRGSSLFGVSNHDVGIIRKLLPDLPVAGLFCNGEFAPVGGRTLLHGYAASLGLFVAKH